MPRRDSRQIPNPSCVPAALMMIAIAACSNGTSPVGRCTAVPSIAIEVTVRDSVSGAVLADSASGTVVTPTFWTQGADFSAAGLLLPRLGDPSLPLHGEPGAALRSHAWLGLDELQELAEPRRPANTLHALYEGRYA